MTQFIHLQSLRIPADWRVEYMHLYDISPEVPEEEFAWEFFQDTMLVFRHKQLNVYLDLGWGPGERSYGRFYLTLLKNDDRYWKHPLFEYSSRNKDRIVSKIEHVIASVSVLLNIEDLKIKNKTIYSKLIPLKVFMGWDIVTNELYENECYSQDVIELGRYTVLDFISDCFGFRIKMHVNFTDGKVCYDVLLEKCITNNCILKSTFFNRLEAVVRFEKILEEISLGKREF